LPARKFFFFLEFFFLLFFLTGCVGIAHIGGGSALYVPGIGVPAFYGFH
jgi:hypothetical protein